MHPTSVVHSMVEFLDGSTLAQASPPSMLIPIALGLGWPDRVADAGARGGLDAAADLGVLPARRRGLPGRPPGPATRASGARPSPAVYNAANEVCVEAFLAGRPPVHRHRADDRRGPARRTTYPRRSTTSPSTTSSPRTRGPATGPAPWSGPAAATEPQEPHADDPAALPARRALLRRRRRGVDRAARDGAPGPGQEVRGQGHAVLRRLRPDRVVDPTRRDRVRRSRRSRSVATSSSSGCSRRPRTTTPAAPAGPRNTGHVHPADLRRPRGGVRARRARRRGPAVLQAAVVEEGHRDGRRADGEPASSRSSSSPPSSASTAPTSRPRRSSVVSQVRDLRARSAAATAPPPTPCRPGREAGLRPGDRITSFNGTPDRDRGPARRR